MIRDDTVWLGVLKRDTLGKIDLESLQGQV